jgi:hypothetical protein
MWKTEVPASWGDWHTKLRKKWLDWQYSRFPDTDPMTEREMKAFLYKVEREYAHEVEAIILRFAECGRWPNNSRAHSYFLARRIEYAMEILAALGSFVYEQPIAETPFVAHEPVPPPTARPAIIVRWLLLDCWEYGRSHWIDRFILSAGRK